MKRFGFLLCIILVFCMTFSTYAGSELEAEQQETVALHNNEIMPLDVTDQKFIINYDSFRVYHTYEFTQYDGGNGNNCGPTLISNALSYYKSLGYNLYSGDITQSMYDEICTRVGYVQGNGTNLYNVPAVIKYYAESAGYKFSSDKYLFNWWDDVKRDISNGKPILLSYMNHGYLVVGYRVVDGRNQVYACTATEISYEWLPFDSNLMNMWAIRIYR